jgi:hypothetical protein
MAAVLAALAAVALSARGSAQTAAPGFALERLYLSAPGAGWFVMDDLRMPQGLNGALDLTVAFARNPLSMSSGGSRLTAVSDEVFADIGAAVSYDGFRLYVDFPMPLYLTGNSGTLGGYSFTAPKVNPGLNPDTIMDFRFGFDARVVGKPGDAFRFGLGAQLYVPSNAPEDSQKNYLTDGTVRAMFRALFAGDLGAYRYAGQLGFHLRPLNQAPIPDAPEGNELLFGGAFGRSFALGDRWIAVVGPEILGETAFTSFFGSTTTGLEALLTGRFEGTGNGAQARVKVGLGVGIVPQFGVPDWRAVVAVELFSNHVEGSKDSAN